MDSKTSNIGELTDSIDSLIFRENLSKRFKKKEKKEDFKAIPNFEKCLLLLCNNIRNCYDLASHDKFKTIPCKRFNLLLNQKIHPINRDIIDFSRRELSLLILAIRLLNDRDTRNKVLENKILSLIADRDITKVSIINTKHYKYF